MIYYNVFVIYNMNYFLHSMQNVLFDIAIFTWYTLFVLTYFDMFKNANYYLDILNTVLKLYISVFLLWRFNNFRNVEFTNLDKKVIFNGALYLFMSTLLVKFIVHKFASNNETPNNLATKIIDSYN
jgi:hypothetical protein